MALPQLNHKNVVRYFGCWAERIEKSEQLKIDTRVKKITAKIASTLKFQQKIETIKEHRRKGGNR